jgi:hypothetical protein
VDTSKKIFLGIGIIGVAVGGFLLTKFLTRNTIKLKYSTVKIQQFDTPPVEEPLTD